jgi:uncharacterized membrane protein
MAKPQSRNNPARPAPATPKPIQNQQPHPGLNMTWSGPLPPPGALQQFNDIIPDGADRIMRMVEAEQAHRIGHEAERLGVMARDTRRGHWIGGIISVSSIGGAVACVALHAPAAVSIAMVGIPVLGMIRVIVSSKTSK